MSKKLLRVGVLVSFCTLLSRILGLVRDILVASLLGAGVSSDVFLFANRIPNFLRRIFAEGAFSKAFIPVFAEIQKTQDISKQKQFIAQVSGTLGVVVSIVTLLGVIGSPVLVALFGSGWFVDYLQNGADAEKFTQASFLLKITFPYLWFITFVGLSGAILNSLGKFGVMAFSPVLLNVCIILIALFANDKFGSSEEVLAWGIFIGGLVQFAFQIPFLKKSGFLVLPRWGWNEPSVIRVKNLMGAAFVGVSIIQFNVLINQIIASFLVTGSITWLYYSDRLIELPLGVFGITISTILLPSLAKIVANKGENFTHTLDWGIKTALLLGLPSASALFVLAKPIILVLFMRGKFNFSDVLATADALKIMCLGLNSYMLVHILNNGFYAHSKPKKVVQIAIKIALVNVLLGLVFAWWLGYVGLAWASVLSAFWNVFLLLKGLKKYKIYEFASQGWQIIGKIALATALMIVMLNYFNPSLEVLQHSSFVEQIWQLTWLITLGATTYFVGLVILGIKIKDFTK